MGRKTDTELERLWDGLADIPIDENECLDCDWMGWKRGTHREEIWQWFDKYHSKGIYWLLYERDMQE